MSKREAKLYIQDIKDSIKKIQGYIKGLDFGDFIKNDEKIDAVVRNLTIIGEAANNIPKEIKTKYSDIEWRKMIGMRNKITHEYFGIDEDILWKTITEDILPLKKQIIKLLKSL